MRELKNEIERAVILNNAGQLDFVLGASPAAHQPADRPSPFLETVADVPTLSSLRSAICATSWSAPRPRARSQRRGNPAQDEALHPVRQAQEYGIPCGSA
ncbi:MAG: hypothetical protein ACLR0N_11690 [Bilophila wadsworthia]